MVEFDKITFFDNIIKTYYKFVYRYENKKKYMYNIYLFFQLEIAFYGLYFYYQLKCRAIFNVLKLTVQSKA